MRLVLSDAARPTPQRAASRVPLGTPTLAPLHAGPHRFLAFQPDSSAPVSYDPCRPLPYVVNARTAPPGGDVLLERAIRRVEEVTGLQFAFEGTTDESVRDGGRAFQPERYGDRWAPILIAWSDASEDPHLQGDVAGRAGSVGVKTPEGRLVYVTGTVTLDGPALGAVLSGSRRGEAHVQGLIQHELGHLVGLDHVDDPAQLMNPRGGHQTDFQSGDVTGLMQLGAGPCVPLL